MPSSYKLFGQIQDPEIKVLPGLHFFKKYNRQFIYLKFNNKTILQFEELGPEQVLQL
jgi:hypothetical protein